MQMEVEKKLYEQIEVQKHLQRRIEAQGKYLQSVLTKAQEALCRHNSSPIGIRLTKDELSQLVTMVNNACPSSPFSELTETRGISLNCGKRKQNNETMCSLESSLTSSESSERKEEKSVSRLMSVDHIDDSSNEANGRKRNAEAKFDSGYVEESSYRKRCGNKLKKAKLSEEMFDLNSQ
ncbi:myb family transcription factor APL, partial [Trifolium medium]|nr:myb family transcription factor APL [Trifolium medium]